MITQLKIRGFKDQGRTVRLSGLDLFSSDNVNGVGKSAVLEAFKLALLGELPGRAKTVDDLLRYTSGDAMAVEITAETAGESVVVERGFRRDAPAGEKRPIRIQHVPYKYETGDRWIRDRMGAVSVAFDPFEFLHLPDARKRQWILSHSPESQTLDAGTLRVWLLAELLAHRAGPGWVDAWAAARGTPVPDPLASGEPASPPEPAALEHALTEAFRDQDPAGFDAARQMLDRIEAIWNRSGPAEENLTAVLAFLKSEAQRLKAAMRELESALAGLESVPRETPTEEMDRCRETIRRLDDEAHAVRARLDGRLAQSAQEKKRGERIRVLRESIAGLAEKLEPKKESEDEASLRALSEKRVDLEPLQERLDRLHRDTADQAARVKDAETRWAGVTRTLALKRDKQNALNPSRFTCPVAEEIRCDTDMAPYRRALAKDIESLTAEETRARAAVERARKELEAGQAQLNAERTRFRDLAAHNRKVQDDIDRLQENRSARDQERAAARATFQAHWEELALLEAEHTAETRNPEAGEETSGLEAALRDLEEKKSQEEARLAQGHRDQGRRDTRVRLQENHHAAQRQLDLVQAGRRRLGPEGLQGRLAARVAGAVETEVNEVLHCIDPGYEFVLDLGGGELQMGWNRNGRVIPFSTLNAAHFVLFVAPFLTALVQRLARVRERQGRPTLKALCIEAEALTPSSLDALLRGLAALKARGRLDHALVAHYRSVRDPARLHGFTEHVLSGCDAAVAVEAG